MSALRQAIALSLAFLVLLTLGGLLLDDVITEEFRAETEEALREEYQRISDRLTREGRFPEEIVTAEVFSDSGVGYAVLRADGKVLGPVLRGAFDSQGFDILEAEALFQPKALETLDRIFDLIDEDDEEEPSDSGPAAEETAAGQLAFDVAFESEADLGWRIYSGAVLDGHLVVYAPGVSAFGSDLTSVILVFVVILSLPALIIGLIFGIRAQRRLNRIGAGFDRIADGDLDLRLAPKVIRDDIDELAARIDGATERLQASIRQMSDFSANIAHDLRTPLTRLRLHLDQADEAEDQTAHREAAIAQMDDIIAIFGAIQRIARMQSQGRRDGFAAVDLGVVVEQVHEIYEAVAQDAGQSLSCRITNAATIHADRSLIMQLLANLIENAIRHAGEGARIAIDLSGSRLAVTDDGPGIPEAERGRVLDPLYRLDRSRNTAGAGLGLAMVKAIAELHEAELALMYSADERGLRIEVRFPQP
ncbi:sensor histidine kinase [Phaeobacter inhibens]|uniref:sensor histidine kinase n=1 Tax=Phaeobacter inhibens TaxID=221822 RepID=UPI000C99B5B5|nr:ATP-binding protein [Phaeobacter inhibens]AUQ66801.1 signal transduction histidine kinase [Phaeobacter inhibens]